VLDSGYFTFNATSRTFTPLDSGYFTFSNETSYTTLDSGYFVFTNTTTYKSIESGYFTFSGESKTYQTLETGWFTFSNQSQFNTIDEGYFVFTAESRNWNTIDDGWFTFTATGERWNNTDSGYFAFSNTSTIKTIDSGWFAFNATTKTFRAEGKYWNTIQSGYFTFRNISTWHAIESGYFTFRNTSLIYSDPTPVNGSSVQIDFDFNITLESPTGDTFDWNISCSNGQYNNSTADSNGSKVLNITGLSYDNNYTIWVNTTHNGVTISHWYSYTMYEINAGFTYTITNSNVKCVANHREHDAYKWDIIIEGTHSSSTGWNNGYDASTYTYTSNQREKISIRLSVRSGTDEGSYQRYIGVVGYVVDKKDAEDYLHEKQCEDNGYYWYNGSCHKKPKELPWNEEKDYDKPFFQTDEDTPLSIQFGEWNINILLVILLIAVILIASKIGKNKKKKSQQDKIISTLKELKNKGKRK